MNRRRLCVCILSLGAGLLAMVGRGTALAAQTATVEVQTVGLGRVAPNYSNAALQIGRAYSVRAAAGAGHRFQKWIVATNWSGGAVKTMPTLVFTMQSNLTLTAMFVDTNRPKLGVTNLTPSQPIRIPVFSNAVFTVKGTAQDNLGISNVWYRLNRGPWTKASGSTPWEAPLALVERANLFQVFAEDTAGNQSLTSTISFTYVATDRMALGTNGSGRITRFFSGDLLELGRRYTVLAVPDSGQVFAGWNGSISSTNNPLNLVMQSNMVLTANFVTNPFLALKGDYNGLFYPTSMMGDITSWAGATNSGFFTMRLAANGSFSGKLVLEGANRPFSGAFNLNLQGQVVVARPGREPLMVSLGLNPDDPVLTGSVERSQQWASPLVARRAATGNSNPYAGAYTLLVQGCDTGGCFTGPDGEPISPADLPEGDSPAAVMVSHTGGVQVTGTLADGTPITQSTAVSDDGYWPLCMFPYSGRGFLIGWVNFANYGGAAMVRWEKDPYVPGTRHFTNGFSSPRIALVTPYQPPISGQNAMGWTNGTVVMNAGDLPASLTNQIVVVGNRITASEGTISNLTLAITPSNGLFTGTFVHPVTGRASRFQGAVVQASQENFPAPSGGWFLGPSVVGTIRLHHNNR